MLQTFYEKIFEVLKCFKFNNNNKRQAYLTLAEIEKPIFRAQNAIKKNSYFMIKL